MTALDQALIKAYPHGATSRRDHSSADPDPAWQGRRNGMEIRPPRRIAARRTKHPEVRTGGADRRAPNRGAENASEGVAAIAAAGSPPFETQSPPPTSGQDR